MIKIEYFYLNIMILGSTLIDLNNNKTEIITF